MTACGSQPLYFGGGLFGWLHRPAAGTDARIALVICNPFGFEEVCAHRGLRQLAIATAEAGIPTLRFDYAGCGNSADEEFDADATAVWVGSVHRAIDGLKAASGVRQVCLLGVRLGATLAALAAVARSDVAGIVAIAPVVRGRAYLRELTVLAQVGSGRPVDARQPAGPLESAGYVLSDKTCAALSRVDLRSLERRPAPRVLIVPRDDLPGSDDWPPALERLGVAVSVAHWDGYARMVDDPQRVKVPHAIIAGVVAQLQTWQADAASAAPADSNWGSASLPRAQPTAAGLLPLIETAVHVAAGPTRLFAIVTRPSDVAAHGTTRPAVLMLNAGSVHLVGPNRLWVQLARRWAARGMTAMRLDISGIGDSPPRPGAEENVVYSRHAADDIAAALAYLRAQPGVGELHVMGLCSGAYHAFKAAVAGQALASALMVNPLTYFWKEGGQLSDVQEYEIFELMSKYRGKLFTIELWRRLIGGRLDLRLISQVALRRLWNIVASYLLAAARLLRLPIRDDLARELEAAVGQGVKLRFVFAAHAPGFALLRKHSGNTILRLQQRRTASLDFVAGADHTFTQLPARERLVALLDRVIGVGSGSGSGTA